MSGRESPPSFSNFSFKYIGAKPPAGTKLPLSQRISDRKIQDPQEQEQNHHESEDNQEGFNGIPDSRGTSPLNNPNPLLTRLGMAEPSVDSGVTSPQIPDLQLAASSTFEVEPVVPTVITSITDQTAKSPLDSLEQPSAATAARLATDVVSDTTEEIGSFVWPLPGERTARAQSFENALGVIFEPSTSAVAVASTIIADSPGPTALLTLSSPASVPAAFGRTTTFKDASSTSSVDMVQGLAKTPLSPLTVLLNEEREAWGEVFVSKQKTPPVEQQSGEKDPTYRMELAMTNVPSQPVTPGLSTSQSASPRSPLLITPELPSQAQTANISSQTQSGSPTALSRLVPAVTPILLTAPTISNISIAYAQAHGATRLSTDLEKEVGNKKEGETITAPVTALVELSRFAPINRTTLPGTHRVHEQDRLSAPQSVGVAPNSSTALPPRNVDDGTSSEPSTMSLGSPEAESSAPSQPGVPQLAGATLPDAVQRRAAAPLPNGGQTVHGVQLRAPSLPGASQVLQVISREERVVRDVGESRGGEGTARNTHSTGLSSVVSSANGPVVSPRGEQEIDQQRHNDDTHKNDGQDKILKAVGPSGLSKSLHSGVQGSHASSLKQAPPPRKPHPLPSRPASGAAASTKAIAGPESMKRKHSAPALLSGDVAPNKRLRQDNQELSGMPSPPLMTSEGKIKVEPPRTPTPPQAISYQSSAQTMLKRKHSLTHVVKTENDSDGVAIASGHAYTQSARPQSPPAKRLREEQSNLENTTETEQQEAQIQGEDDFMFPAPESPTGRSSTSNQGPSTAEVNKAPLHQRLSSTQPGAVVSQHNERSTSATNEFSTKATSLDRSIKPPSDRDHSSRRSSMLRGGSPRSGGWNRDEDERGRRTTRGYRSPSPIPRFGYDRRSSHSGDSYRPYSPSPPVRGTSPGYRGSSYRGSGGGRARTPPRRIGHPSPRNRTPPRNVRLPSDGRSSWRSAGDFLPPYRAPFQTDSRRFSRQISPESNNRTLANDRMDRRLRNERASRSPSPIRRDFERNSPRESYNESKRPLARSPGRNTPPHMRQIERGPFPQDENYRRYTYDRRASMYRPGRNASPNPRYADQREGSSSRPNRHNDDQYTQQSSSNFFVDGGPDQDGDRVSRPQEITSAIRHAPMQQRLIQSDIDAPNPEQAFLGDHNLGNVYDKPEQSYNTGYPPGRGGALSSTQLQANAPLDSLYLQAHEISARPGSSQNSYDGYIAPEVNPRYRYVDGSSDGPDDEEDVEDAYDLAGNGDDARTSPNRLPYPRVPALQTPFQTAEPEALSHTKPQARPLPPSPPRGPQNLPRKPSTQNKRKKDEDLKLTTTTPMVPKSPVARLELRDRFDIPPPQIQTPSTPIIRRPSRSGPSPTTNNPIRFADRISSAPALPIRPNGEDSVGERRGRRTPQEDERSHRRRSSSDTTPALLDRLNDQLTPTRVVPPRGGGRGQVRGRGRGRGRGQGHTAGVGRPDQSDNAKLSLEDRLS